MSQTTLFRTTISAIGAEVSDLIEGGVLILFDSSAPPELAEVSVLHHDAGPVGRAPVPGDRLHVGTEALCITAVGETAWQKISDIGHVVFNLSGATTAERPSEICLESVSAATLLEVLEPGAVLEIRARDWAAA